MFSRSGNPQTLTAVAALAALLAAPQWPACDTHPDHDTIAKFRRENFEAVAACFVHVLELAQELKLLKVGTVSVDGTTLKANASKNRNVRYDRAGELVEQLELEVRASCPA